MDNTDSYLTDIGMTREEYFATGWMQHDVRFADDAPDESVEWEGPPELTPANWNEMTPDERRHSILWDASISDHRGR